MKQIIKKFLFGERIKGEPVAAPTIRTVNVNPFMTFGQWVQYVQFSRQYHV